MLNGGSAPDPYVFGEILLYGVPYSGFNNITGKTRRSPVLNLGEKTSVFICAGQSNICTLVDTAYTPTNAAKIDNLNVYDGGLYAATDALLGCSKALLGNHILRMADKLITAGVTQRVILVTVGVGGTTIALWQSVLYQRIVAALRRCAALNLPVTAILWHQGESDNSAGTTQALYAARLTAVMGLVGATVPWFVSQVSYIQGTTSAAVTAAQASLVNGTTILPGPATDVITASGRQADNTHFNATGADQAASLWIPKLTGLV